MANNNLPTRLYRAKQVRELDRVAIEEQGIPGFTLMRRAAKAAFTILLAQYPEPEKLTIFCGTGNNGGDGYAMASLARQRGLEVALIQCGDAGKISGDALQARQHALQDGVEVTDFSADLVIEQGVIIDALLGTGLSGDVRGVSAEAIGLINSLDLPVLAVDIPSGLCSDAGRVLGNALYADHTVSFIGLKQGLLTGAGPDYTGALHFHDLSVPETVFQQVASSSERLDLPQLLAQLPARQASAHKGHFGHVMVTGGDSGMAGAAAMASQAACRVGAGLISCATRPEHIPAIIARSPEVMAHGVISGQEIEPLLAAASVVVVGPGLGQGAWGEQLLQKVAELTVPLVVDADALNLLAAGRVIKNRQRDNWILTPHPGEAARLLGCSTAEVQQDRFAAAAELQRRYGGAVILKGAGTLVADDENSQVGLCPYGNPGMATGGMGDVLSGVLGALLAQGFSPAQAARLGVCLHATAGDRAAVQGQRGMMATDLLPHLRTLINQLA
ncbi:bifunctional ADP-dependent (S)-NAD(P)H-hydrate dehydratase/NAD(P)H-hydrate epimerase [Oceanicoccus sagamiensis]|uniref:Bifunctional NAD(P)H-hydrate repair enzyme n=1 Tax=Oceanicoccus sagamiensis TaxID=716816 RepID=A0A1X9NNN8_9GAMM|nr:bifunctional ADP-dependent (S)-NAD(P)H-hydrate dehydratase/NAD(P)H-hydrate epimerase [Oceanicoccus sagamiensis]